jgi:hypothetical protein
MVCRVKEALILLTLKSGNIFLLRNILNETHAFPSDHSDVTDPKETLQDFKVYKLGPEQAKFVINLRVDVS